MGAHPHGPHRRFPNAARPSTSARHGTWQRMAEGNQRRRPPPLYPPHTSSGFLPAGAWLSACARSSTSASPADPARKILRQILPSGRRALLRSAGSRASRVGSCRAPTAPPWTVRRGSSIAALPAFDAPLGGRLPLLRPRASLPPHDVLALAPPRAVGLPLAARSWSAPLWEPPAPWARRPSPRSQATWPQEPASCLDGG